jgi:hypothetical protein
MIAVKCCQCLLKLRRKGNGRPSILGSHERVNLSEYHWSTCVERLSEITHTKPDEMRRVDYPPLALTGRDTSESQ